MDSFELVAFAAAESVFQNLFVVGLILKSIYVLKFVLVKIY